MAIVQKMQALNAVDLSKLSERLRRLYEDASRTPAVSGGSGRNSAAALDENWVRRELLPMLKKIDRLRS